MKLFRIMKKLLLVVLCCTAFISCGEKNGDDTEQETNGTVEDATPVPIDQNNGNFSQKIDENGMLGDALSMTGKAFGGLPVVGKEDAIYCNLPENVMDWNSIVPLCADPLYGILYYVDYGGDYMIHAVYNGEAQTVVEVPGRRLFCRGGKLYFLLDSYNQFPIEGARSGNVAEYDPVTGVVRILSDQQFTSMVVYQDLIYCKLKGKTSKYGDIYVEGADYWFYFFDTGVWEQEDPKEGYVSNFQRYGEYFMAATVKESEDDPRYSLQTGMELRSWDGERGAAWDGLLPSYTYFVKDGGICWLDQEGFHIWNLALGQEAVYLQDYECAGQQYVLAGGRIYNTQYWLADLENNRFEKWHSMDENLKMVHEFYTDGEAVYAITGPLTSSVDKNSVLRRVQALQGAERFDIVAGVAVSEVGLQFLLIGE